jgi:AmmeMemoRadiSam system protein A
LSQDAEAISPVGLARHAVELYVTERRVLSAPTPVIGQLAERAGVFVCIKRRNGELRGCVGTVAPERKNIAEEIIHNAIVAATEDPRFAATHSEELEDLVYSVDILSVPEPVSDMAELDPAIYGVVVEDEDERRGLLLPGLAGVETAQQQVAIAMKKAKIPDGAPIQCFRFTVKRISEEPLT